MKQHSFETPLGTIRYWRGTPCPGQPVLVFLPGLTADHRLFDGQIRRFEGRYELLTWDAPGHGASRPFRLEFSLMDKAGWLHDILRAEGLQNPVLVGQSMGGYVAQCYMQRYPGTVRGFLSIDSASLQRRYYTAAELWLLRRCEPIYRLYPWKSLLKAGPQGCAETPAAQEMMRAMMQSYTPQEYARLAGHGFRLLADAIGADLPYAIDCPALLLCGEKDKAGSTRRYNRRWNREGGLPLTVIPGAGHNSNADAPAAVNAAIENFVKNLPPLN